MHQQLYLSGHSKEAVKYAQENMYCMFIATLFNSKVRKLPKLPLTTNEQTIIILDCHVTDVGNSN